MFQASRAVFFYCVSPVHMGAGSAVGVIDNPIQREKHSDHPMFAGSGLKGALRHSFVTLGGDVKLIDRLFGPDTKASDHAGAFSFGDAQLVVFPVRSLRGGFVYATCPYALARLHRLLTLTAKAPDWAVPEAPKSGEGCTVINDGELLADNALHLEVFQFTQNESAKDALQKVAQWLADMCLPKCASHDFFRKKLKNDLVLLSDEDFKYFVQNATTVEAHVRIEETTGTAKDGGLFYTENLPPESLLVAPLMASAERTPEKRRNGETVLDAGAVLGEITSVLAKKSGLMQVGGDATTGRGLVVVHVLES